MSEVNWNRLIGEKVKFWGSKKGTEGIGIITEQTDIHLIVELPEESGEGISKPALLLSKSAIEEHSKQDCHTPDCPLHDILDLIKEESK